MKVQEVKLRLQESILSRIFSVPEVISVTLVGSFVDRLDLVGISDIDTVVVCNELNEKVFNQCLNIAQGISLQECGLEGFRLKINTSFGPLKFDEPDLVVLHLMLYSVIGHENHVIESPFTCLDWERSDCFMGESLQELFPVGKLQVRDFLEARRGLENYLEDLENGTISIRNYEFVQNNPIELKERHPLDERHRGEYAFHIVRNLISNAMKLGHGENRFHSTPQLEKGIERFFDKTNTKHSDNFRVLALLKEQRSKSFPEWTLQWTKEFISDFQYVFLSRWRQARIVYFTRHSQTPLNDGSFLGQGRNPGILPDEIPPIPNLELEIIYSSPAKRCLETAERISRTTQLISDIRLQEIDYGLAEGWFYEELNANFPHITQSWSEGEDPNFPGGGENTASVSARLQNFIRDIEKNDDGTTLIVTHNVVLRCLIGNAHSIPIQYWYRLHIPHTELFEFRLIEGKLVPNICRRQLGVIFKNLRKS